MKGAHRAAADPRFEPLSIERTDCAPPAGALRVIERCAGDAASLMARVGSRRIPSFHHSTGWTPWQILDALRAAGVVQGPRFVEWGSGLGVTTMLAALQGLDALGIEIEARLVDRATALAEELEVHCTFLRGDLFASSPTGDEAAYRDDGPEPWPLLGADLVYVYPWPAEVPRMFELFAARSPRTGTVLAIYHGGLQIDLYRWRGEA